MAPPHSAVIASVTHDAGLRGHVGAGVSGSRPCAGFLLKTGMLDAVVKRSELKQLIAESLDFFCGPVA